MDYLCGLLTDGARRRALKELPPDLYSTYDRILYRVNQKGEDVRKVVERVMRWLYDDSHSLTTKQICEAITVEPGIFTFDPDDLLEIDVILECCGSLVRLSAEGYGLQLAHFTVKEYLRSDRLYESQDLSRYYCDGEIVSGYKARTSLTSLCLEENSFDTLLSYDGLISKSPFYLHAARRWPQYVFECYGQFDEEGCEDVGELLEEFFSARFQQFATWKRVYVFSSWERYMELANRAYPDRGASRDQKWSQAKLLAADAKAQHFAATLRCPVLFEALLAQGTDWNERCALGTPLHCALFGEEGIRLAMGAELGARKYLNAGATTTMKDLIALGADVTASLYRKGVCHRSQEGFCTPLCIACRERDLSTIRILLEGGAQLDRHFILTQLDRCTLVGMDDDFFNLARSQHVAEADREIFTKLCAALARENPETETPRRTELSAMTQSPMHDIDIESSLTLACETDALELLQSLVDTYPFDIIHHRILRSKTSLLHLAAFHDSFRVSRYLLKHGVDANEVDDRGWTPLHAAFRGIGSMALVRLLLEHNAEVNTVDREGNTVLQLGAIITPGDWFCATTLSRLVAKGADLEHRNKNGHTIFHIVAIQSRITWLTLWRDCLGIELLTKTLRLPDDNGMLPVHYAALHCKTDMLKMLLEMDPYPTARESDGRNVLHFAARGIRHGTSAMSMLFERDLNIAAKAYDGSTLVHDCVRSLEGFHYFVDAAHSKTIAKNFHHAIQMLHTHGYEIAESRQYLETPLHYLCTVIANDGFCPNDSPCDMCREISRCTSVLVEHMQDEKVEDSGGSTAMSILLANAYRDEPPEPIEYNHTAIESMIHLLEGCVSVDPKYIRCGKKSALGVAAFVRNEALLLRLLELNANVDSEEEFEIGCFTPLQMLCLKGIGSRRVIDSALARTADIHRHDKGGRGLLHLAVCYSSPRPELRTNVINALLDAGISIESLGGAPETTPLMFAVESENIDHVSTLLARGANPSFRDSEGWTAFTTACQYDSIEIAQSLLDAGASWEFVQCRGKTEVFRILYGVKQFYLGPLQLAALGCSNKMAQKIIQWQLEGRDRLEYLKGPSPLWWASYIGAQEVAETLLQSGANPDAVDPVLGLSCLQIAAANGHTSVMKILLDAGCDANARDSLQRTASTLATVFKQQKAIHLLSERLADLPESSAVGRDTGVHSKQSHKMRLRTSRFSPSHLIELIREGDVEAVKKVQADAVDISEPFECGCTPLILAIIWDKLDLCDLLLNRKVSANNRACVYHGSEQYSCYELAVLESGRIGLLTKLLETSSWLALSDEARSLQGADMLCIASVEGNVHAVKELIRHNVDPNWISSSRFPQDDLQEARRLPIDKDLLLLVEVLKDGLVAEGHTVPLHAAILADELNVAEVLLAGGADVNLASKTEDLGTALHLAARLGEHEKMTFLLEHGANPNVIDRLGYTPAHIAARSGLTHILETLAKYGADLSPRDEHSPTVLMEAIRNGHLALAANLFSKGHTLRESAHAGSDLIRVFLARAFSGSNDFTRGVSSASKTFMLNVVGQLEARNYLQSPRLPNRWMLRLVKRFSPSSLLRNLCFDHALDTSSEALCSVHQAASQGSTEAVELLVDAGAMINMESGTLGSPLMYASTNGRMAIVKLLVRHGALISYRKRSTIFSAVKAARHFPEIVRWLIHGRYMDQRKLTNETNGTFPTCVRPCHGVSRRTSFAPATSKREVPWDTYEFIAAEDVDDFVRRKLEEMRLGMFLCRQDGYVELITRDSARL